jgi:hypothetical protein
VRIGGYCRIYLAAHLALSAPELEPFLPFFVPPNPLYFAASFMAPLASFPSLPMPPSLSFARLGVLLAVLSPTQSATKPSAESIGTLGYLYTAQDLSQHLVAHAAPTPPMMPAAVVPVVAVPFPLDQPKHPLRVAEVTPDLADVHVRPFPDSFPA